jgi:hypothetical protein
MVTHGPFVLEVPGSTFRFELHNSGPYVLGKQGRPLVTQPGPRSLFWEAYWQWERQGKQVDDQGRCIFKWETALVHVRDQVGHLLDVTTTKLPACTEPTVYTPRSTAKVTIRSIPADAEIFADGRFVGNAPAVLTLPVGKHHFRASLKGYADWSRELELIPDSELTLVANLVKVTR